VNSQLLRRSAIAVAIGLSIVLSFGCVVGGDGYGYGYNDNVSVGIGLGYYEPYGNYYGGWGPGYRVGPSRGGNFRPDRGSGHPAPHAYRPAPLSRPMPSIPARPRQRPEGQRPH
jgi:hypothetical protein